MENKHPMLAKAQKSTVWAGLSTTVPDNEAARNRCPARCGAYRCHMSIGHPGRHRVTIGKITYRWWGS